MRIQVEEEALWMVDEVICELLVRELQEFGEQERVFGCSMGTALGLLKQFWSSLCNFKEEKGKP